MNMKGLFAKCTVNKFILNVIIKRDNSIYFHDNNLYHLTTEIYEVKHDQSGEIMKAVFNDFLYELRSNAIYLNIEFYTFWNRLCKKYCS